MASSKATTATKYFEELPIARSKAIQSIGQVTLATLPGGVVETTSASHVSDSRRSMFCRSNWSRRWGGRIYRFLSLCKRRV